MKNAMNISVQVFAWTNAFLYLGYIPRSGIAGLYGNSTFNFFRNGQTFAQQLHHFTFPSAIKVPISPHLHQHLLFPAGSFDSNYFNGYEVVSHRGIDLHFPNH